jgi:multiple sugar transport system substrate-binding protein
MAQRSIGERISRRRFLEGAGLVLAGTALAACAPAATTVPTQAAQPSEATAAPAEPAPTQAPPSAEKVELRVSAWADVPDKNINDRVAALVAELKPNIVLLPENYPGGYYDKIKVNIAGGDSADLLYMEGYNWQPFVDAVVPLDPMIEADSMAKGWPDVPNYANLTRWRGQTYLTVIDTGSMPMFYNKTIFDKRGIPYPADDWTFEDFKELVAQLTFEEDGIKYYGFDLAGGAWTAGYVWWVPWLRMDGKLEFDTIVEPKKAQWTQQELVDAMQFVCYDVIEKGYAPTPDTVAGGGVGIATDRVAMGIQGPWYLPQLRGPQAVKEGGVDFEVVMPPRGAAGTFPDAEIQGHMIWKGSKHQAEAWEVMKIWMGEEAAKITAEEGRMCGTPENTDKYWVPIATERFGFKRADVFVQAQSMGQSPMIGGAGANFTALEGAGGPLAAAAEAMYGLQKTAREALEEANVLIQQMLDDYWAKQQQ